MLYFPYYARTLNASDSNGRDARNQRGNPLESLGAKNRAASECLVERINEGVKTVVFRQSACWRHLPAAGERVRHASIGGIRAAGVAT